jgi:hypothetical protein
MNRMPQALRPKPLLPVAAFLVAVCQSVGVCKQTSTRCLSNAQDKRQGDSKQREQREGNRLEVSSGKRLNNAQVSN